MNQGTNACNDEGNGHELTGFTWELYLALALALALALNGLFPPPSSAKVSSVFGLTANR